MVAQYNNTSVVQIQEIFENAGAKSIAYDDEIYREAGLSPKPIAQSKSIMQLLEATAKRTNYNLKNLTMTTANTSHTKFLNAINKAYLEVSTGIKSYSKAVIDVITDVSKEGATIEYPSGRKMNIESAVRMNVVTSVNQTLRKITRAKS